MSANTPDPTVTTVDLAGVEATHLQWDDIVLPDYETLPMTATKQLQRLLAHIHNVRADLNELRERPTYTVVNTSNVLRIINVRDALDALDAFERALARVVGRPTATPQEEASS